MASSSAMISAMLLVLLHVALVRGVTMDARDVKALTAVRDAVENTAGFPPIGCSTVVGEPFLCDATGRVIAINIFGSGLKGKIAPEIGNLTKLTKIILSDNQLTGSIPSSVGKLKCLQTLWLFSNDLNGSIPYSIGDLTSLQNLNLEDNQLSGSIPWSIGNLNSLKSLSLHLNQLNGSIPWSIGNLKSLKTLYLSKQHVEWKYSMVYRQFESPQHLFFHRALNNNTLSGSIPWSIGDLASLHILSLYDNQLRGSIPWSIGKLTLLTELLLNDNQLSGSIPWSIGSLTSLKYLWLFGNQLSGRVPSSISNLKSLSKFYISNNYFTGPIVQVNGLPPCSKLATNCLFGSNLPTGCSSTSQRSMSTCLSFCNATQAGGPCGGHGSCSFSTDGTTPACACNKGYTNNANKYTCE